MSNSQAYWTTADEVAFIEYLHQHRAESGDGGSFKSTTFNGAAEYLKPRRTRGAEKTGRSCGNKWASLRKIFRAIQAIKAQSGWTWTDDGGANITPEMEGVWASFLLQHKEAKPFKNHGWIHLKNVSDIMPATLRGTHVYAPISGTVGMSGGGTGPSSSPPLAETPLSPPHHQLDVEGGVNDLENPFVDTNSPLRESPPREIQPNDSDPEAPVSSPLPESRKRRHDASASGSGGVKKKAKLTGADAIESLTHSLNAFGDNICKVLSVDSSLWTPQRRRDALKKVQDEIWLVNADRLVLFSVLTNSISAVDAYASLDRTDETWSRAVIQGMIDNANI